MKFVFWCPQSKFYWHTATPIHTVPSSMAAFTLYPQNCHKDPMSCRVKNICPCPLQKTLLRLERRDCKAGFQPPPFQALLG